jgi:hypothetical protein
VNEEECIPYPYIFHQVQTYFAGHCEIHLQTILQYNKIRLKNSKIPFIDKILSS